jgi:hypothetical protein
MRLLLVTALICIAGCAGQPTQSPSTAVAAAHDSTASTSKNVKSKRIPERVKGPYRIVMRGDKKLYCTKELATGSHVNHRTICLTPEEYADIEAKSREAVRSMNSGINPPSQPPGLGAMAPQ